MLDGWRFISLEDFVSLLFVFGISTPAVSLSERFDVVCLESTAWHISTTVASLSECFDVMCLESATGDTISTTVGVPE